MVIPTNAPVIRKDQNDLIYKTEEEKWHAAADEIIDCHQRGQPVLVGTTSVEKSEYLSSVLRKHDVPHNVLNAKFHEMEAAYVAQAGRFAAVTIATNMAGRGTDIVLGGNPEFMAKLEVGNDDGPEYTAALARHKAECEVERGKVLGAGGLHIIGTERHESRRVDNQLRGRAGRQGDPGSSRFYISLDDELMRLFGADRIRKVMETLRMPDGEPIEHRWINSAVERAQKKVEDRNFGIRKNVLEYDDVMNDQRKAVYNLRDQILFGDGTHTRIIEAIDNVCYRACDDYFPEGVHLDEVETDGLIASIKNQFNCTIAFDKSGLSSFEDYRKTATDQVTAFYEKREQDIVNALKRAGDAQGHETSDEVALERWRFFERERFLRAIDTLWKHHLKVMENLKEGIHLESYGQKDPKIEYKKQGFGLFLMMMDKIDENVTEVLFRAQGPSEEEITAIRQRREEEEQKMILGRGGDGTNVERPPQDGAGAGRVLHQGGTYVRALQKVGRNDLCPCGSGQKFKKCHEGRVEELAALMKQRGGRTAAHL